MSVYEPTRVEGEHECEMCGGDGYVGEDVDGEPIVCPDCDGMGTIVE